MALAARDLRHCDHHAAGLPTIRSGQREQLDVASAAEPEIRHAQTDREYGARSTANRARNRVAGKAAVGDDFGPRTEHAALRIARRLSGVCVLFISVLRTVISNRAGVRHTRKHERK